MHMYMYMYRLRYLCMLSPFKPQTIGGSFNIATVTEPQFSKSATCAWMTHWMTHEICEVSRGKVLASSLRRREPKKVARRLRRTSV